MRYRIVRYPLTGLYQAQRKTWYGGWTPVVYSRVADAMLPAAWDNLIISSPSYEGCMTALESWHQKTRIKPTTWTQIGSDFIIRP